MPPRQYCLSGLRWSFLPLLASGSTAIRCFPPVVAAFHSNAYLDDRKIHAVALRYPRRNHYPRQRRSLTHHHLFFRSTESGPPPRRRQTINSECLETLQSSHLELPFQLTFDDVESSLGADGMLDETLYVRHMVLEDIHKIMPMCIEEFGLGSTMSLGDFPFYDLRKISNWWDRVYFEPSIYLSLRAKINANLNSRSKAKDPTVLVLCTQEEIIMGMVEISLQPPDANKNPPAFPVPDCFKDLYCRLTKSRLQGWVTNLLIDPQYRGLGYSKLLMAASEGIAKSWGCNYIYLHADADYRSGKTAQSLYKGLGYDVVTDQGPEYAWMGGAGSQSNPFSSIRVIEGVPLLCFSKRLD